MLTEEQIIQGCQQGIKTHQRELVVRYSPLLMAACRRYVHDGAAAKDVLQETFIRIFTHIHRYQPTGSFENWMRRIAVRCALTWLDKSKIKKEIELTEIHLSKAVEPEVYHYLGFQAINTLIDELPIGYRTVFNLNVVEGYTHKEIAELLDITESASRSQLARAKKLLRQKINLVDCQKKASL